MRRLLLWLLLALLCVLTLLIVFGHDDGFGTAIAQLQAAPLASKFAIVAAVTALGLILLGRRSARLTAALAVSVLVVAAGYASRAELQGMGARAAALARGDHPKRGRAVEIVRGAAGSFSLVGQINGARVNLVLDTGATSVVLTQEAAKAAGLPIEMLSYSVPLDTANGRAHAAAVTLDRLAVGRIVERSVPALIAQPGQLRASLLGMSFLNRLQGWEVHDDRITMRGYP